MKPLLLLIFTIAVLYSCGLSAKKQNKKLVKACQTEQQKQEDAMTAFKKKQAVFDSLKLVADGNIRFLEYGEEQVRDRFKTFSGLIYQLNELGAEQPSLTINSKTNSVPDYQTLVRPIQNTLNATFFFEKVDAKADLGDLSLKEQNKVWNKKLEEYKRAALSNSIQQEEIERNCEYMDALLVGMDSLGDIYQKLTNDLTSDNWKLQDRLSQLETEFRKKGPAGFSEAYFLIFPEVFPGFVSSGKKLQFNPVPVYNALSEDASISDAPFEDSVTHERTTEFASFPGGKEEMDRFIKKNLTLPQSVLERIVSGNVYVKFTVSEKGEISAPEVLTGISGCPECSEEAIRLVNSMPNWVPGKENGKAVRLYVRLPINFEL